MFWCSLRDKNDLRVIGMHVKSSPCYADSAITLYSAHHQAIAAHLILLFYLFIGTPGKYRCMATTSLHHVNTMQPRIKKQEHIYWRESPHPIAPRLVETYSPRKKVL